MTEKSDIDLVVILDELSVSGIQKYNEMLDMLPNKNLICGFLSGKDEILHLDTSDLFQFYYDTKPLVGSLDELQPMIDEVSVRRAIKIGVFCSSGYRLFENGGIRKTSKGFA